MHLMPQHLLMLRMICMESSMLLEITLSIRRSEMKLYEMEIIPWITLRDWDYIIAKATVVPPRSMMSFGVYKYLTNA
ncbi:hypothetical protein C4D60_Mb08t05660 [Musa balbisiana]|uniref:Uncharacterized protein n=1 Tax=Musa balbisiana TaxID=52838 RepID=A0A4S8K1J8_MUSBA|nr:hypothetical protein C4D60_Mb08t05660 [Musa balbisiana]